MSSTGSKPITNSLEGKGLEQACLDDDTGACFSYPFNFNCLSGWFMVVDLWCCRNIPRFGGLYGQYDLVEYASGAPIQFSYKELKGLTNGFNEKLGAGSFGSIYRGMLGNGTIVVVKQIQGIELEEKQFKLEIATKCNTHHMNLSWKLLPIQEHCWIGRVGSTLNLDLHVKK